MKKKLSAAIITLNEEQDLPACLESLRGVADEIVVLDNHSTDRTREIAKEFTPQVHQRAFTNYAEQKQAALDKTTGDWVLSIDADERVSPELAREIARILESDPAENAFDVPFEIHFLGRRMRFGGLGAETHLRLFRREAGRFIGGEVHEGIHVEGKIGRLNGKIIHLPYRDLDEYLSKLPRYTTLAAQKRYTAGRRYSPLHLLLPVWELFVRLVLRLGVLDGTAGIAWWGLSSFHTWMKFLKLREMERTKGEPR